MSDLSASLLGMPHHGDAWADFGRLGAAPTASASKPPAPSPADGAVDSIGSEAERRARS